MNREKQCRRVGNEKMNETAWRSFLKTESFKKQMTLLYGDNADKGTERFDELLSMYRNVYGEAENILLASAPGRTEIGGNHTDHQKGRVLAASVDMDMIAAAAPNGDNVIRVTSAGYPETVIAVSELSSIVEAEKNTTPSLIRGVAAGFEQRGAVIHGFNAVVTSSVLPGSGISSSAAFETLIGNIINGLFCDQKETAERIAMIGQFAENVYFGKPSGLMDQMASSVGNLLTIDFADEAKPEVRRLDVDFDKAGLALCITNCGADHADLTDEYAAIPGELKKVCAVFHKNVLREISKKEFLEHLPEVRKAAGDRAVLRSLHFYADNDRVPAQAKALEEGDIAAFLKLVNESGCSSWTHLQNIVPCGSKEHQEMGVALAVSEELLAGEGACRVHGGGFAGTIQAFVPKERLNEYKAGMEAVFGEGSCHVLKIRPVGGVVISEK